MSSLKHLFDELVKVTDDGYVIAACSKCGERITIDKKPGDSWQLIEDEDETLR